MSFSNPFWPTTLCSSNLNHFQDTNLDLSAKVDIETDDFLVEIECLTSRVLRETSLWNLHMQQEGGSGENYESDRFDDNSNDGLFCEDKGANNYNENI